MDAFVPLGRVVKAHGLKGEVSVAPATDLPFSLPAGLHVWFVPPPARVRQGRVEWVRPGPKGPLVKVAGVDDIDTAAALAGSTLVARSGDLPPEWSEKRFDPIGVKVTDERFGLLGEVHDVIGTAANEVWVVRGARGEVLVPAAEGIVLGIDEDARAARVRLPDGLVEGT